MCGMFMFINICPGCRRSHVLDEHTKHFSCGEASQEGIYGLCREGVSMEEYVKEQVCCPCSPAAASDSDAGGSPSPLSSPSSSPPGPSQLQEVDDSFMGFPRTPANVMNIRNWPVATRRSNSAAPSSVAADDDDVQMEDHVGGGISRKRSRDMVGEDEEDQPGLLKRQRSEETMGW